MSTRSQSHTHQTATYTQNQSRQRFIVTQFTLWIYDAPFLPAFFSYSILLLPFAFSLSFSPSLTGGSSNPTSSALVITTERPFVFFICQFYCVYLARYFMFFLAISTEFFLVRADVIEIGRVRKLIPLFFFFHPLCFRFQNESLKCCVTNG